MTLFWQYLAECDDVILMKDGQIAEHGTHAQLMARERDYASLFNSVQQEVMGAFLQGKHALSLSLSHIYCIKYIYIHHTHTHIIETHTQTHKIDHCTCLNDSLAERGLCEMLICTVILIINAASDLESLLSQRPASVDIIDTT